MPRHRDSLRADDLARWVAAGPFHPSFWARENAEAQLAIHAAARFSHQYLADTGHVRVAGGCPSQEHSQAASPVGGIDEHVAQPGERGAIGNQPGEPGLGTVGGIQSQRQ